MKTFAAFEGIWYMFLNPAWNESYANLRVGAQDVLSFGLFFELHPYTSYSFEQKDHEESAPDQTNCTTYINLRKISMNLP